MTPLDFIKGGDHYNDPIGEHQRALDLPVRLTDGGSDYRILSYYIGHDGKYVLDIHKIRKVKK